MYKIYFGDRYLLITDKSNDISENVYLYHSIKDIKSLIETFDNDTTIKTLTIINANTDIVFDSLIDTFNCIYAAGGLVRNINRDFLFIYRYNRWDLPKGKIEKGETPELCAVREVAEECGIDGHFIIKALSPSYHTYHDKKKLFIKKTYWFEMLYEGNEIGHPQIEECITKIEWIKQSDFAKVLCNTYASIQDKLYNV